MQKRLPHLIACLLFCANCFAQQYPFVHYTPKDGLVNSRVRKAYQDSRGRMYFMTYGGLSVYDGARFKNYTSQNGLLSDLVNDVLEVGEDSLLVAINTCGLNMLVRGEMKIAPFHSDSCFTLNQLVKGNDGVIYGTADQGLYKLGEGKIKKLLASRQIPYLGAIADYKDFVVFTTNDLKLFNGLFLYDKRSDSIIDALPQLVVLNLKSDRNNIIWVNNGKDLMNLDTLSLASGHLVLREPYTPYIHDSRLAIGALSFNSRNELLVISGDAILQYSPARPPVYIDSPDPSGVTQAFFIDREDVVWICHAGNGLYKLSNTKLQATNIFSSQDNSHVSMVKSFNRGLSWIAMSDGKWIRRTVAGNKTFKLLPSIDALPLQMSKKQLYAFRANELFIGPLPGDNETTIRLTKIATVPDTSEFRDQSVVDPYENVILFERRNICVYQEGKQIFAYPFPTYDLIQGMYVDKNKLLWVVSRTNGIWIFSLHPESPSQYLQKQFQFSRELEMASPRCMVVDKKESVWIGTRSHGVLAFVLSNGRLKKTQQFQTQNGLTDNFVTSLACDDDNNIIIGTQTGLDRLIRLKDSSYLLENITRSKNIFAYINYTWTEGNTSFAVSNTGTVLQVEPALWSINAAQPQLMIEEMKINGRPVPATSAFLQLNYYQRNISFSVAAPTFIDEKQVKYSYYLSGGGGKNWSDTSAVADITLLNLSPGNYTLHVKAFFPSTDYAPREMAFGFQILPPWWQTAWFRLITALLAIAVLFIAVRFYYRNKLRQQKLTLEKQQAVERERTRIATDMHDDLGAGLSRIKFLSETIGIKKQQQLPIEEDISKIREYSHEMIDKMGEIVWALNEKNDSLSDLLSYTRSYAAEYLSQNGIACEVDLPDSLSSAFVSGEFRRNVFLAVKEILHNVVKHSEAGCVHITMAANHELFIAIKDDGTGFDRSKIRPFSNGLMNIEKRMKDIGGNVSIAAKEGTVVELKIPLSL